MMHGLHHYDISLSMAVHDAWMHHYERFGILRTFGRENQSDNFAGSNGPRCLLE